ncbi:MAG: LCP family protein [Bacillota bacterium]|nr:LCP family protein [Bacillota bacterium]
MKHEEWSASGKSRVAKKNKANSEQAATLDYSPKVAKRRAKDRGPTLMIFLMVLLLIGSVYIGFNYMDKLLALDNQTVLEDEELAGLIDGPKKRDVLSVLLVGVDQREKEPTRADTMVLVLFDKKTKELNLLSLPRDTRAKIPGRQTEKLNHAYAYGGADLTQEAVEDLLNIKLDGYVSTNFNGFANIVEIIGGIDYNVEDRMYYPEENIDLQPGQQKLDGADALAYVRYRSDGRGDLGRMERQQKFLKVLANELLSVANVLKVPSLIKEFNSNVKTDISTLDLVSIANAMKSIDTSTINAQTIPGEARYINNINYYEIDQAKTKELLDGILYEPEEKEEEI